MVRLEEIHFLGGVSSLLSILGLTVLISSMDPE